MPVFDPTALGLEAVARLLLDAVRDGQWSLVVAVVLACGVALVRHFLKDKVPFLQSDLGAILLVLGSSFFGALVTSLMAGEPLNKGLLLLAVGVAWKAAGGFTAFKKAVWPLVSTVLPKVLAFLKGAQ